MDWGIIRTDGSIELQKNPVKVEIHNPTEAQKATCAGLLGQIEVVYTEAPEYDPETQYLVNHFEEIDGKAVQVWEVKDKPEPEPSLEDRVEDLEGGMDELLGGEA